MNAQKIIDRVIWWVLGSLGVFLIKYLGDLAETNRDLSLQLSRLTTQLHYHEQELQNIRGKDEIIFRLESEMGTHEKRLLKLERKNGRN